MNLLLTAADSRGQGPDKCPSLHRLFVDKLIFQLTIASLRQLADLQ